MVQWITRVTLDQKIPCLTPAGLVLFCFVFLFLGGVVCLLMSFEIPLVPGLPCYMYFKFNLIFKFDIISFT